MKTTIVICGNDIVAAYIAAQEFGEGTDVKFLFPAKEFQKINNLKPLLNANSVFLSQVDKPNVMPRDVETFARRFPYSTFVYANVVCPHYRQPDNDVITITRSTEDNKAIYSSYVGTCASYKTKTAVPPEVIFIAHRAEITSSNSFSANEKRIKLATKLAAFCADKQNAIAFAQWIQTKTLSLPQGLNEIVKFISDLCGGEELAATIGVEQDKLEKWLESGWVVDVAADTIGQNAVVNVDVGYTVNLMPGYAIQTYISREDGRPPRGNGYLADSSWVAEGFDLVYAKDGVINFVVAIGPSSENDILNIMLQKATIAKMVAGDWARVKIITNSPFANSYSERKFAPLYGLQGITSLTNKLTAIQF